MTTKRKVKRYAEGDEVVDMRDNADNSVSDDTRARAMRFMQTGKKDDEESTPVAKKLTPIVKKTPSAAKKEEPTKENSGPSMAETKANISRLKKEDKPLEEVHPEDILPGGGLLKNLAKRATRMVERKAIENGSKDAVKQIGYDKTVANRRSAEGYPADEAMAARKSADDAFKESAAKRSEAAKKGIEAKSDRTKSSGAMSGDFKPSEIRKGFKRGGSVKRMASGGKSSASSRGDGIATKGFTRGKYC